MTPDEHRARAEELTADAENMYRDIRLELDERDDETAPDGHVGQGDWNLVQTTLQLAQVHATLAVKSSPAKPSFEPTYESLDAGLGPRGYEDSGIVNYGDDAPTYDRQ